MTTTRVQLPENITRLMNAWRDGFIPMPQEYIKFHEELAVKALEELKTKGLKVYNTEVKSDGWMDGMKALEVVAETAKGELVKLQWSDSNQEFFKKIPNGGGSVPFRLS